MIEAAMREGDRRAMRVDEPQAGFGLNAANARHSHPGALPRSDNGFAGVGRCGEAKFVVVATGQCALQLKRRRLRGQHCGARDLVHHDRRPNTGLREDVAKIAQQAVRYVKCCSGDTA